MQEQWSQTRDTREAAAFGTLGVPIRTQATLIQKTAERKVMFLLAMRSVDGVYDTRKLRQAYLSGKQQRSEPGHPFLNIMRGFENRNRLLDCMNQGQLIHLVPVPGTEVFQYVKSDVGLPGIAGYSEVIKTADLKLVAALGGVGLPLLRIDGNGKDRLFYLPRHGPPRANGLPPVDGHALRAAWYADKASVPWEDPFAQAMRGLYNRERLLDHIHGEENLVLIQNPGSIKTAGVRESSLESNKVWKRVTEHFED